MSDWTMHRLCVSREVRIAGRWEKWHVHVYCLTWLWKMQIEPLYKMKVLFHPLSIIYTKPSSISYKIEGLQGASIYIFQPKSCDGDRNWLTCYQPRPMNAVWGWCQWFNTSVIKLLASEIGVLWEQLLVNIVLIVSCNEWCCIAAWKLLQIVHRHCFQIGAANLGLECPALTHHLLVSFVVTHKYLHLLWHGLFNATLE